MRRPWAVVVVLILSVTAARVGAQAAWTAPVAGWGSYWCPTCYVAMNVDVPNLETPYTGTIQGWAFECGSGQPIDRVDVYYQNATGFNRAQSYLAAVNVPRPDVVQYFAPSCPSVTSTAGFAIGFTTPIPPGTWTMSVVVWKGMLSTTQTGVVVVP